jgi:hypothetical protein
MATTMRAGDVTLHDLGAWVQGNTRTTCPAAATGGSNSWRCAAPHSAPGAGHPLPDGGE